MNLKINRSKPSGVIIELECAYICFLIGMSRPACTVFLLEKKCVALAPKIEELEKSSH
jgi:hypothetical protein